MPLIFMLVNILLTIGAIASVITVGVMLFHKFIKYDTDHPKDE